MYRFLIILIGLSSAIIPQKVGFGLDVDFGNRAMGIATNVVIQRNNPGEYFILGFGIHTSYSGDRKGTNILPSTLNNSTKIKDYETSKTYLGFQFGFSSNNFLFTGLLDYADYQKYTTYKISYVNMGEYSVIDEEATKLFFGAGIQYIYKSHAFGINYHSGRQISFRYSVFFL